MELNSSSGEFIQKVVFTGVSLEEFDNPALNVIMLRVETDLIRDSGPVLLVSISGVLVVAEIIFIIAIDNTLELGRLGVGVELLELLLGSKESDGSLLSSCIGNRPVKILRSPVGS